MFLVHKIPLLLDSSNFWVEYRSARNFFFDQLLYLVVFGVSDLLETIDLILQNIDLRLMFCQKLLNLGLVEIGEATFEIAHFILSHLLGL